MSYSVKFGLLPAKSLPSANLHKNIGDKTPSPLTVQDSKGLSPLAGRGGQDKLGLKDINLSSVRYKFATGKLA